MWRVLQEIERGVIRVNKAILMGRLVRDPEVKYAGNGNAVAIANYTLAVNRKFKREGDAEADFINCVAIGKAGEFAEKFLSKGMQILVNGRLQVRSWEDKDGNKRHVTEVIVEEHYFTETKKGNSSEAKGFGNVDSNIGFVEANASEEDDLPF